MSEDFLLCEAGCKHFSGGEVKHHKDCVHYPESLSKMYDDMEWIKCSDRLPDSNIRIQYRYVSYKDGSVKVGVFHNGKPTTAATHWMPLPKPPTT